MRFVSNNMLNKYGRYIAIFVCTLYWITHYIALFVANYAIVYSLCLYMLKVALEHVNRYTHVRRHVNGAITIFTFLVAQAHYYKDLFRSPGLHLNWIMFSHVCFMANI